MNPIQDFTISNAELPKAEKRSRKKKEATVEVKEKKPRSRKSAVKEIVGDLPAPAKELNDEVIKMEKKSKKEGPKVISSQAFEASEPPASASIGMKHPYYRHIAKMEKGHKWIQDAIEEMKRKGTVGAFTKSAKRHKESPKEFAEEVLENPEKHIKKTRKRAQFVKNVAKKAEESDKDEESESDVEKPKAHKKRGGSAEHMKKMREARMKKMAEKK